MNTVEDYFDYVRQLIQDASDARAERYETGRTVPL